MFQHSFLHNFSLGFILLILVLGRCRSYQPSGERHDYGLQEPETYYTTAVLKLRESYSLESKVLKILPPNSLANCTRETVAEHTIDGLKAKWLKCTSLNREGWLFAGYLSRHRSIEQGKTNVFQALGNDSAEITLALNKGGSFTLKFRMLSGDTEDKYPTIWRGSWSLAAKSTRLILNFENSSTPERLLFFWQREPADQKETDQVTVLGPSRYSVKLNDGLLRIWGENCEIVTILP